MSKFARAVIPGVALSLVVTIVVATADPHGNTAANQLKVALLSFPIWVCAAYQVARIWDSGASGTTRFVAIVAIVSFVAACLLIVASSPSVNSDGLGALDVLGVSGALLVLLATIRNVTAIRDTDAVDPT